MTWQSTLGSRSFRVWFVARFVSEFVCASGSCLGLCLVRVWFVFGSRPVCVWFVPDSGTWFRFCSALDSYLNRIQSYLACI